MKLNIDYIAGQEFYVAEILGLDARYRFARDFLDGIHRPLRATGGQSNRMRCCYVLTDGLYEISEPNHRSYLAVVNNRRIPLNIADVKSMEQVCNESDYELETVLNEWIASKKRSSASLATIANEVTAARRAELDAKEGERQKREASQRRKKQKSEAEQRRKKVRTMTAREAFDGSDASVTRLFLKRIDQGGAEGTLAAQLFRVQKASARAKVYRGDYGEMAYNRKSAAIRQLCALLGDKSEIRWGWKEDPAEGYATWVLYVDLPQGQVSFHSPDRHDGPDYIGEWDRQFASEERIVGYCKSVLSPQLCL